MSLSITGIRSELGRVLAQRAGAGGAGAVHFSLAGQQANTLLHDGHAWKGFARRLRDATQRALRQAQDEGAPMLVHASFAFVQAVEQGAGIDAPLRSAVDAILDNEALVLAGPLPACVVRLGYLYGPGSADLRAYRSAFHLGRPYWAGPRKALQYHLHLADAAAALRAAARPRNRGKLFHATDDTPASFRQMMDAFAHRVGRKRPLHLPALSRLLARLIIREEHMQQVALAMPPGLPGPRPPGWEPSFPSYREGLDQVIAAWDA